MPRSRTCCGRLSCEKNVRGRRFQTTDGRLGRVGRRTIKPKAPRPNSISTSEPGSGVAVTSVSEPEVRPQLADTAVTPTSVLVSSGPPVYPTREPAVGVANTKVKPELIPGLTILRSVRPLTGEIPTNCVKGPATGDSPLMVTSVEMTAPVVLLMTMSPPSVHDGEHAATPRVGVKVPETSSIVSACA